ncbi:hypothetical protein DUI87_10786 [Hirundo rustica rustica]|uniref:Uncharacterized protein n=1 Tax=Hirundo rustica rustica TaxID=333673 RepID=A0A3M0KJ22_HIRRU|nr:hypothetical protein DUI87_10786 [Hirundo rustica rustica]
MSPISVRQASHGFQMEMTILEIPSLAKLTGTRMYPADCGMAVFEQLICHHNAEALMLETINHAMKKDARKAINSAANIYQTTAKGNVLLVEKEATKTRHSPQSLQTLARRPTKSQALPIQRAETLWWWFSNDSLMERTSQPENSDSVYPKSGKPTVVQNKAS